ncbi:MAG: hypothetical protein HKL95_06610 [Phycisphaerae bacterium]|nr:hypothetical protein [Phycisphaerae bacterium]
MNGNKPTARSLVARCLKSHQPESLRWRRKKSCVLVQPDKSGVRAFEYNGNLADTEAEIRDHEWQPPDLLLVPVLPPDADDRCRKENES